MEDSLSNSANPPLTSTSSVAESVTVESEQSKEEEADGGGVSKEVETGEGGVSKDQKVVETGGGGVPKDHEEAGPETDRGGVAKTEEANGEVVDCEETQTNTELNSA